MGARFITLMILLTTDLAQKTLSMNTLLNEENSNDFNKNISTGNRNLDSGKEGFKKEDMSKTMELILFRPYTSMAGLENNIKGSNKNNNNPKHLIFIRSTQTERNDEKYDEINKNIVKDKRLTRANDTNHLDVNYSEINDMTNKPLARYEITENVIDIPDDRTPAGPIVPNYTPYRNTPINLGTLTNNTEIKTENDDEDNKNSKSRLSILHIDAEFDETKKNQSKIRTFFKDVKQYISGIKSDFVRGINKLFRKNTTHSKELASSEEIDGEDEFDKDDDFSELHHNIHKHF